MKNTKLTPQASKALHFTKFKEGNEQGLEFFYKIWHPILYYRGLRYIKDEVNADCIVNEAFLRLWLFRKQIHTAEEVERFVQRLTADGCKAYFKTGNKQFQRNMLRLDDLEHYQEFLGANDPGFDDEEQTYHAEPDEQFREQWERVEALIPKLSTNQQLFIRLCIRYGFDYGRIAWHIGGISDYQVAKKVEQTLQCLKAMITDSQKLESLSKASAFKFEGDIGEEQNDILRMRYELHYSFEDIAKALNLSQHYIQRAFINAISKVKKVKTSNHG